MTDLPNRTTAGRNPCLVHLLAVLVLVAGWALAGATFGYAGVIIPALALVPTMFLFLICISRG